MINTILQASEQFGSRQTFVPSPAGCANVPVTVYENDGAFPRTLRVESDSMSTSEESQTDDQMAPDSTHPDIDLWSYSEIKHSLKEKIRFRRESEGAEEIWNLFEPPKKYKLTAEEERKNLIRKRRNRVSANKSRLKRIAREKNLEKEAKDLETDHAKLVKEVEDLRKHKHRLLQEYKDHLPTCKTSHQATKGDELEYNVPTVSATKESPHPSYATPNKYITLERITELDWPVPKVKSEPLDDEFERVLREVKLRNDNSALSKHNQTNFPTSTMSLPTASSCKLTYPSTSISSRVDTTGLLDRKGTTHHGHPSGVLSSNWTGTPTNHSVHVDATPVFNPQTTYLQEINNQSGQTMSECHDEILQCVLNDLELPRSEGVLNVGQHSNGTPLPVRSTIQQSGNNITDFKPHRSSVAGINLCPYLTENEKIDKIKSYLYDL